MSHEIARYLPEEAKRYVADRPYYQPVFLGDNGMVLGDGGPVDDLGHCPLRAAMVPMGIGDTFPGSPNANVISEALRSYWAEHGQIYTSKEIWQAAWDFLVRWDDNAIDSLEEAMGLVTHGND